MIYRGSFVRFHRSDMTLQDVYGMPGGYTCATAIYRRGYLCIGYDTLAALVIFNETNVASPILQINMWKYVRAVSFARNDTLMFVAVQRGNCPSELSYLFTFLYLVSWTRSWLQDSGLGWSLYIYNISWIPTITTSLVQTLRPTSNQTWSMHTVNDSFVLMASWDWGVSAYAISPASGTNNTWVRAPLNATRTKPSESMEEVVTDPCGRIWVIVYGFGIRIFDQSATILLANWTLSTGLSNILLLNNYELFLSDYDNDVIYRFNPNLQCTS